MITKIFHILKHNCFWFFGFQNSCNFKKQIALFVIVKPVFMPQTILLRDSSN